jgi:hypothetical protein
MSSTEELYQIADKLRAVACLGRRFAENHYDVERYEQVLAASARLIAVLEQRSPDEVLAQFQDNLLHVSPLAGAEAAVCRNGQILLNPARGRRPVGLAGRLDGSGRDAD